MALRVEDGRRPKWSTKDPWSPIQHTPGAYPPSPNARSPIIPSGASDEPRSVADVVRARRDEYIRKKTIKVKVGTWNVAALPGTRKDLGGWFADGLGVKGLTQNLSGLSTSSSSSDLSDSEVESIEEQEGRFRKKRTTLPEHDSPAVLHGNEVDLYVLGLQEVIDISSMTEAVKPYTDPNPGRRWKHAIKRALPPGYQKVAEEQLLGLLLLIFASPKLKHDISSVDTTHVGTGLLGYLGNKGAVSARILLGETTRMLFVNCHLAAGADPTALSRRIWDTNQILSRTQFAPVGDECVYGSRRPEHIGDEDIAFWFGDLNYRLDDIPGEDVRRLLLLHARNEYDVLNKSKRRIDSELGRIPAESQENITIPRQDPDAENPATVSAAEPNLDPENDPASLHTTLKSLLTHDQLHAQQRLRKAFYEGWREGDINFLPTYKYDVGSVAMFDSGEKKRSPSWCDRILYRTRLDYEQYKMRSKLEAEARKKDEDMKKRGLDDAASQEDVLFDYDPETDGGNDFDDQDQYNENQRDMELTRTKSALEDAVILQEYVTHQRVLSSDHKPLTAVFNVTYDSVDQALKARIHDQVTRDFDKAENEARPSVTLVLDQAFHNTTVADTSLESTELRMVDFGEVRYSVTYEHHLLIANTGQIDVTYAFVGRPVEGSGETPVCPFPWWLTVVINQDVDNAKIGPPDLGQDTRYTLEPGETTNIDLVLEIREQEMVKRLNSGDVALDDILVLRISNGRDYFIPVKGVWLQSCFYRSVDELVRIPSGVRALTLKTNESEAQLQPASAVVHSAPQELFMLTEIVPSLVERVVADWDMLHDDEEPPWKNLQSHSWPFNYKDNIDIDVDIKAERLSEIREALDTAESIDRHLSPCTDAAEKLGLVSEILLTFLASLTDGIITNEVWKKIEAQLLKYEKSKSIMTPEQLQEMAMEAVSSTPVHSVSLTFITFMLNRMITEISASSLDKATSSQSSTRRARSSTSASAMSDVSLSSHALIKTKRSIFTSLTRRTTNSSTTSSLTSSIEPTAEPMEKNQLAHRYAEVFAPLIIRSQEEPKMWAKERKAQLARKVKILKAFLNQSS